MKKLIILILVFFGVLFIAIWAQRKKENKSSQLLQNDLKITGKILKIKISSNHNFGVILFSTNDPIKFDDKKYEDTRFPYSVSKGIAEVYTRIPDGVSVGDSIKVISNLETVFYYDIHKNRKTEEYIYMIDDPTDIKFIEENTNFN